MKIIYAVSPNHLEDLLQEAREFEFALQGYGNPYTAAQQLIKTNIVDILGFVYVGEKVSDLQDGILKYVNLCNMISRNQPRKFVFALRNNKGLESLLKRANTENLYIVNIPQYEILTDSLIRKQIFGSILLDNYEPYELNKKSVEIVHFNSTKLEYVPLFQEYVLQCLSDIKLCSNLAETLSTDKVFLEYSKDDSDYATIRKEMIKQKFGLSVDVGLLQERLAEKEGDDYCIFRALISKIL